MKNSLRSAFITSAASLGLALSSGAFPYTVVVPDELAETDRFLLADFTNLLAQGGYLVSAEMRDGRLVSKTVRRVGEN